MSRLPALAIIVPGGAVAKPPVTRIDGSRAPQLCPWTDTQVDAASGTAYSAIMVGALSTSDRLV